MATQSPHMRPIGYQWLIETYELEALPPHQRSWALQQGTPQIVQREGRIERRYPRHYEPPGEPGPHLEFALKHEGYHLDILVAVFDRITEAELLRFVRSKPNGKYARKLWFLFEYLTGRRLELDDSSAVYVPLLPPADYFVGTARRSRRHRVLNNLMGDRRFAPIVRRTTRLNAADPTRLARRVAELVGEYEPAMVARAVAYLYVKETRSSFAIERETVNTDRMQRFGSALRTALDSDRLDKTALLDLHAVIVDPRFAERDYRLSQNYVGQTLGPGREHVHYVSPRPDDVPDMMAGLLDLLADVAGSETDPVVAAAVAAFGLVFIHPFEDGNGRLHRCLIHWVLARRQFSPPGLILPVSAVMLARRLEYDQCLETFSRPLLDVIDYDLDADGVMTVGSDTSRHYRYFDATPLAEALYEWIEASIETELRAELDFLVHHADATSAVRAIVDLPDRLSDLFIRLCLDNGFRLSKRKRQSTFSMLTDDEVAALEIAVGDSFGETE
jgi:hypothetical protein